MYPDEDLEQKANSAYGNARHGNIDVNTDSIWRALFVSIPAKTFDYGDNSMTTWREMIAREMDLRGESLADIVSNTLTDEEMYAKFDAGYGSAEGKPFTVWTANRVYFPAEYDGAEGVESVSRNPDGEATSHI